MRRGEGRSLRAGAQGKHVRCQATCFCSACVGKVRRGKREAVFVFASSTQFQPSSLLNLDSCSGVKWQMCRLTLWETA